MQIVLRFLLPSHVVATPQSKILGTNCIHQFQCFGCQISNRQDIGIVVIVGILLVVWDGQILDFDLFVIPKGAPNKEAALDFIKFSTDTQRLADQASWISYGPARKSSGALVGLFNDGKTEMAPHMPTAAANLENALVNNFEFWVDRDAELNERFNAWLAQ